MGAIEIGGGVGLGPAGAVLGEELGRQHAALEIAEEVAVRPQRG